MGARGLKLSSDIIYGWPLSMFLLIDWSVCPDLIRWCNATGDCRWKIRCRPSFFISIFIFLIKYRHNLSFNPWRDHCSVAWQHIEEQLWDLLTKHECNKNKTRNNAFFILKNKKFQKRLIKIVVDKWTKLLKPNEKMHGFSVHDNVWLWWLFISQTMIQSDKSLVGLVELKILTN